MIKLGIIRENLHLALFKIRKPHLYSSFQIEGHLSEREGEELYRLAKSLIFDCTILEIGSYKGRSTNFLLHGARRIKKLYALDTFTNIDMSEGPKNTYGDFLANIKKFGSSVVIVRGLSSDSKNINKIPLDIDLIFLDADHSYSAVKLDIANFIKNLKPKGLFVFHDYGNPTGVKKAVDEFIHNGKLIKSHQIDSMLVTYKG